MPRPYENLGRLLRRALAWWLGELAETVPPSVRRFAAGSRDRLLLLLGDEAVEIKLQRRDGTVAQHLDSVPLAMLGTTRASLPAALQEARLRRQLSAGRLSICIRLPASRALRTRFQLPAAAEADLEQVLRFELDRRTPFSQQTACFTHRIVARDRRGALEVELTVAPRTAVAAATDLALRLGLQPNIVDVAPPPGSTNPSGNLLLEGTRSRRRLTAAAPWAAAALAIGFLAAALLWIQHGAAQDLAALRRQAQESRTLADEAMKIREEIAQAGNSARFLAARRGEMPAASQIIEELSRILPDDTWLLQLNLRGRHLDIAGFSGSASSLIQILGDSGMFAEPKFRSAVLRDATVGRERFELTMTIGAEAQP